MEFLQCRFTQGVALYEQRICNHLPFYDAIHGAIDAVLRVPLPDQAELLVVGVNRPAVESDMNERTKAI